MSKLLKSSLFIANRDIIIRLYFYAIISLLLFSNYPQFIRLLSLQHQLGFVVILSHFYSLVLITNLNNKNNNKNFWCVAFIVMVKAGKAFNVCSLRNAVHIESLYNC